MKLLIELFGEHRAIVLMDNWKTEHPGLHIDWYIRQIVTTYSRF